jgi:hypothetical protein
MKLGMHQVSFRHDPYNAPGGYAERIDLADRKYDPSPLSARKKRSVLSRNVEMAPSSARKGNNLGRLRQVLLNSISTDTEHGGPPPRVASTQSGSWSISYILARYKQSAALGLQASAAWTLIELLEMGSKLASRDEGP